MSSPQSNTIDGTKLIVHLFEVELQKDPEIGFGFNIIGGVDEPHIPGHTGIFISQIRPDGPAAKDGRLRPGDRIVSVNDIALTLKTHSEAVEIFRQATGKVRLVIEQDAETLLLSQPAVVVPTPVADSPVDNLRQSILIKSAKSPSSVPSATSVQPEPVMAATVVAVPVLTASPNDSGISSSQQFEKTKGDSDVSTVNDNISSSASRTRQQSFRDPLVTPQPSENSQRTSVSSPGQNIPSVVYPNASTNFEDDDDRASTISVAPSTYSVVDDVPRTPKKPVSIFDPTSPSLLTEAIFITIGALGIGLGVAFAYRYFKRR